MDDDEADEELFDISQFKKKKNSVPVSVKKTY